MAHPHCLGKHVQAGPISKAQQGEDYLWHQISDGGLERYAYKVTGGKTVSVGVKCGYETFIKREAMAVNKTMIVVCCAFGKC